MQEIKQWLEKYAQELENTVERKLHILCGRYKGEYYENGKFTTIQGRLFITTHRGNLFKVYDDKTNIEDTFDVFDSNATIIIDEDFFTYVVSKGEKDYAISLKQINLDLKMLENHFIMLSGAWEDRDGDECDDIAEEELLLVKSFAERYPFEYEYEPSNFDKNPNDLDEDWSNIKFDIKDFNTNNVNKTNYIKVDAVASDFKYDLMMMINQLKNELKWLPPRFRQEFVEIICECPQTAKTVRKNSEYFAETIDDELTEEERSKMFITLG